MLGHHTDLYATETRLISYFSFFNSWEETNSLSTTGKDPFLNLYLILVPSGGRIDKSRTHHDTFFLLSWSQYLSLLVFPLFSSHLCFLFLVRTFPGRPYRCHDHLSLVCSIFLILAFCSRLILVLPRLRLLTSWFSSHTYQNPLFFSVHFSVASSFHSTYLHTSIVSPEFALETFEISAAAEMTG